MNNPPDDNESARSNYVFESPLASGAREGEGLKEPHEAGERIAGIEPWEEPENTQGFQHGSWNYAHSTRNEVGPALAEPGNKDHPDTVRAEEAE
jgi:hypothetical protein